MRLSLFTTTVLDHFGGVAVWTLHINSILLALITFSNAIPADVQVLLRRASYRHCIVAQQ